MNVMRAAWKMYNAECRIEGVPFNRYMFATRLRWAWADAKGENTGYTITEDERKQISMGA